MATIWLLLAEHRQAVSHIENHTEAIYLAQAGVMQALYDFRRGVGVSLGEGVVDAGPAPGSADDDVFVLGANQADVFLVNIKAPITFPTSGGPMTCGVRNRFQGWFIRNVLASGGASSVVSQMKVNWSSPSPPDEGVVRVDLNGFSAADWTAPGCVAPLPDAPFTLTSAASSRTLSPGAAGRWVENRIWFKTDMASKAWIDVTYIMTDGSQRLNHYESAIGNRWADFTVKSVGEVRKGLFPFLTWRRLQAEYRICSGVASSAACDTESEERTAVGALMSYQELTQKSP